MSACTHAGDCLAESATWDEAKAWCEAEAGERSMWEWYREGRGGKTECFRRWVEACGAGELRKRDEQKRENRGGR